MSIVFRQLAASAMFASVVLSAPVFAASTVYTSSAAFLANVAPGAYLNTFTGLTNPAPTSFSSSGFSYNVSAEGGLYASGSLLGANLPNAALVINFTSGNVTAVGGNFYLTRINDEFLSTAVTLTLSDGTTRSYTPASATVDSYSGFIAPAAITSLTILGPITGTNYTNMDNLTIGIAAAVPEPSTWLLMAMGIGGLLVARQRRAA